MHFLQIEIKELVSFPLENYVQYVPCQQNLKQNLSAISSLTALVMP